jgi:flagellar hook-basal body complex protein FliE
MQIPAIQGSLAGVSPAASVTGLGDVGSAGTLGSSGSAGSGGFGSMLTNAISSLNQTQNTASSDSVALATGQASDVTQVVTDVEKANLEMQLAVQVRNKAVDAYQELMRMQI